MKCYNEHCRDIATRRVELPLGTHRFVTLLDLYLLSSGAQPIKTEDEEICKTEDLNRREKNIAENIQSSLEDGETWILLVGMNHHQEKWRQESSTSTGIW